MNRIVLKGLIRNIKPSHKIKDIEYEQANLIVARKDGKEDTLTLKFKKFSNPHTENKQIALVGNVRSFSQKGENKNKVEVFVHTYFDLPEEEEYDYTNKLIVDGRICKLDELRTTKNGKHNIHFILANNLINLDNTQKLNSYLPCVAWGKLAQHISDTLSINDKVEIVGELHSREYTKKLENDEIEIRVAHEIIVTDIRKVEE